MATIDLLDGPIEDRDEAAIASAETWMARIPELFITERSKQVQLGISEVGMDCRKCIARKLAEKKRKDGVVNDWKVVGKATITDARKKKIKHQYRVQAMLYAYGWEQKGFEVTHVALSFLPREDKLENAVVSLMRYDKQLALDSLAVLESMIDAAEVAGWDAVIDRQPKPSFCFSCRRYDETDHDDLSSLLPSL